MSLQVCKRKPNSAHLGVMVVKDVADDEQDLTAASGASQSNTAPFSRRKEFTMATRLSTPLTSEAFLLRELELAPVTMYPQQVSRAMEIRLCLSRIEFIDIHEVVTREEGTNYFVLDVYRYRQQKGLPSTRCSRRNSLTSSIKSLANRELKNRRPDYHIEQRYSSFARLRSNVAHSARKHHLLCKSCAYCARLSNFLHMTPWKPSLKVKFTTTTDERKSILSAFINDLVYITREGYTSCPRSLGGYHIIPAFVKRFLAKQTGETFFS